MSIFDKIKSAIIPPKNPEELARAIIEKIANMSFGLFKNENFREMNNFNKLEITEQDRIFNEILVTGIALSILTFETLESRAKNERIKGSYSEIQVEIASRYPNWLKELGGEENNIDLWRDLIKMRVEEYENDFKENEKEIKKRSDTPLPYIFVTAIGGAKHISRSNKKIMDNIFKPFLKWNITLVNEILKIMEKYLP